MQYAEVLSRSFALTAFVADRDRHPRRSGRGGATLPTAASASRWKGDGVPQALPQRGATPSMSCCPARARCGHCSARGPSSRQGMSPGRGSAGRRPHPAARPCPAEGCGGGGSVPGKADGRVNIIIIGGASAFLAGAPFFVYDRIMNLYKLFREAIDREKNFWL